MRVLYVEDEKFLAQAVKHNLEKQQIDADLAFDGEQGLELAKKKIYDVIILDVMLPKMSGLDILSYLRAHKIDTPIIMLSALSEVENKVRGLNTGADDYLAKPFKTAELIARLNALTRRPSELSQAKLCYADLTYDLAEKELNGARLTEKEAKIMEEFLKNPEKTINKNYLRTHVWGPTAHADDNRLEVYISRLRKLLAKIDSSARIVTARSLGYKLKSK